MTYMMRARALLLGLLACWLLQPVVYAQANQPAFVDIVNVDTKQAPTVQLSLVGGNLPTDLGALPLKVFEGDQAQTVSADNTVITGIQLAFVIDPHNLLATGESGQTHHAEVARAAFDLIGSNVITRNVDLLAVYSSQADGTLQTIQDWTKEPNLLFNSIVQTKPENVGADVAFTDLVLQALDKFTPQTPQLARVMVLFSTGGGQFDADKVAAKAQDRNVFIDTVEMAAPNQSAGQASALQQLAQQTQSNYVFLSSMQNLKTLWTSLGTLRLQRTVSYKSSSATPGPLKLQLTLPDNTNIEATAKPSNVTSGAAQPKQAITTTVPVAVAQAATNTVAAPTATTAVVAAAAPVTDNTTTANAPTATNPVVEDSGNSSVIIPGLGIAIPRLALQLALPLLILLLVYFIYRDWRERRAQAAPNPNLNLRRNSRDSRMYELADPEGDLKPLPKNRPSASSYSLNVEQPAAPPQTAEPLPTPRRMAPVVEEDPNEDATVMPRPMFGDDEATYRLSEQIEQPVIGYFVRRSGSATLPNELPIYGLNATRGEARQIHIGRHTKNNTVVINDKSVSREHAVIVQKENRLYLRDNASTAGTFLNGKRLQPGEELLLRHNDLVSFGEVSYEFHAKGEDEATVASE